MMTKNEILKKIGIIIIELREQYDLTQLNRDDINDIELELFVANSHFLTDHIEILRKLNNQDIKALRHDRPKPEPTWFEPLVKTALSEPKEPNIDVKEDEPEYDLAAEDETGVEEPVKEEYMPVPVIRHEVVFDEPAYTAPVTNEAEEEIPEVFEDVPAEEYAEVIDEPEIETQTAAPQPEEEAPQTVVNYADDDKPLVTVNQILSAQSASYTGASYLPPVTDIKSAINLNDKLLFVRDLFNGYSMAYGEAIEILNRFNRFEEADQFLKLNYYTKNNWEAKQATTDKFYELLQRRFPL